MLAMLFTAIVALPHAVAQGREKITTATVCDLDQRPAAFDNKWVKLTATLAGNFEVSAILDSVHRDCDSVWFTYPGSGPAASFSISTLTPTQPRPPVRLKLNRQFRRFQNLANARMYPRQERTYCMDCKRYEVTAVMTGLVEFAGPGQGFGHMNGYPIQFVLQSVEHTSIKDLAAHYNATEFSTTPVRFPTGYLSGHLLGADGRPISEGDLNIYSATDPSANVEDDSATTDREGRFTFAVPPGKYIIGFNTFWPPSPKFPFPPTYYPSTPQRSAANVVAVADKQHVRDLTLRLPAALVPRNFPVKVVWPDGSAVAEANVWLSQVSDPTSVVGMSVSHTSSDGNFDLVGFEGVDYILHADKYGGLAQVSCAKNVLIRAGTPFPDRIQLPLTRTDFNICKNTDFEVPTD